MAKPTYVFMGSPAFGATILERLLSGVGPPLLVVTQEAKPTGRGKKILPTAVAEFARAHSLPLLETSSISDEAHVQRLKDLKPDLLLVAAFGQILRKAVLEVPNQYCLNVHASLLPRYRGAAPIQRAILEGEKETGVTIQKMALKLDTGDILLKRTQPIALGTTSVELFESLALLGAEALVQAVEQIENSQAQFVPQDHSKATYAAKLRKEEATIDWGNGAEQIVRQVAALQPWPIAHATLGGERMRIFGAELIDKIENIAAGAIVTDHKTFIQVGCGDGKSVLLTEIQLDNRKKLATGDFLKGFRAHFPFDSFT